MNDYNQSFVLEDFANGLFQRMSLSVGVLLNDNFQKNEAAIPPSVSRPFFA